MSRGEGQGRDRIGLGVGLRGSDGEGRVGL